MSQSIPCSNEEYFYKVDNMVLSSGQHLRNVFKRRWKAESGTNWVDEENCIKTFLQGIGKNALNKAPAFQKKTLNGSSSVEEWDMSLLSTVIQSFGDEKKYEKENLAVRKLKNMRNDLAHHTTKKFTMEEYSDNVQRFKESLGCLGMMESDIEKLIERAGVTSSLKAYERVKVLFGEAEGLMELGKFEEAMERYTDAINTPSLLPVNLGEGYEKRADCYLKSEKNQVVDGEHCDQALLDVTQALELNSSSWNAHYLAAQCHRRKNNLSTAVSHYEKSVAISPAQKHVKQDLDSCKVLAGIHRREDHMNPRMMPMNLEERVNHLQNETGIKMSGKEFIDFNRMHTGRFAPGQDHVFIGHQYHQGWGVPQSFTEAVKYYAKADALGNPDGSYNLAQCYHYGRGAKQDLDKALQIYRRVAEMDKNILGEVTPFKCNLAVALAQHAIGLMYDNGIGVGRDCAEAAKWYKRAMDNGIGNSANNLGILYFNGQGVPVDEKMAERCWKDAIELKDVNAPAALMSYYVSQLEPEKALHMFCIGRQMGNSDLIAIPDDEFDKIIEEIKAEREKSENIVAQYEYQNRLDTKGLTFKERATRALLQENRNLEKIIQIGENAERNALGLGTHNQSWGGKAQGLTIEVIKTLMEKAFVGGSETALRLVKTFDYCKELNDILDEADEYSDAKKLKMLDLLYNCATLEFHFVFFRSLDSRQKLKTIIDKLFHEKCDTKGNDDMKIRLCYSRFNLGGSFQSPVDTYALEIIKEGVRRYPDNSSYHDLYLCCLAFKQKYKEGASCAAVALESFPNDPDLLYNRAVLLRFCTGDIPNSESVQEVVQAFKNFINAAPCDHRKVPEAFYQMSNLYLVDFVFHGFSDSKFLLVEDAYKSGLAAEKQQLPCYLPYGESDLKAYVGAFLAEKKNSPEYALPKTSVTDHKLKSTVTNEPKHVSPVKSSVECKPTPPVQSKVEQKPTLSVKPKLSILERKLYLKGAVRKGIIKEHRLHLQYSKKQGPLVASHTVAPKLQQTVAKKMSMVKPITLQEMNPTQDRIFENRILDLVIVDEPNPFPHSIHLVAEDDTGDVTRLYIYNVKKDKETMDKFQVGSRIAIINPYMRIGAQSITNGIRNDEPRCIVYLEKVVDMCRFCGEENASQRCSKCKRPYCSRECQKLDWKEMDHKYICSRKIE